MVGDIIHDEFISFAKSVGRFRLNGNLKGSLPICVANQACDIFYPTNSAIDVANPN